jgi:hypothetical protein
VHGQVDEQCVASDGDRVIKACRRHHRCWDCCITNTARSEKARKY